MNGKGSFDNQKRKTKNYIVRFVKMYPNSEFSKEPYTELQIRMGGGERATEPLQKEPYILTTEKIRKRHLVQKGWK